MKWKPEFRFFYIFIERRRFVNIGSKRASLYFLSGCRGINFIFDENFLFSRRSKYLPKRKTWSWLPLCCWLYATNQRNFIEQLVRCGKGWLIKSFLAKFKATFSTQTIRSVKNYVSDLNLHTLVLNRSVKHPNFSFNLKDSSRKVHHQLRSLQAKHLVNQLKNSSLESVSFS